MTARSCACASSRRDYDPHDRIAAMNYPAGARTRRARSSPACSMSIRRAEDMHDYLNTVDKPLNELGTAELVPGNAALAKLNESLR